jgi:diacylglycerol kinase (ATP)
LDDVKEALRRLGRTTRWSVQGWRAAWATQISLRQWTGVTLVSAVFALLLDLSAGERALLLALGLLLLAAELFNTAVEAAVDFVSTASDPRSHGQGVRQRRCGPDRPCRVFRLVCDLVGGNGLALCRGTGRSMSNGTAPSCRARKGIPNVLQ